MMSNDAHGLNAATNEGDDQDHGAAAATDDDEIKYCDGNDRDADDGGQDKHVCTYARCICKFFHLAAEVAGGGLHSGALRFVCAPVRFFGLNVAHPALPSGLPRRRVRTGTAQMLFTNTRGLIDRNSTHMIHTHARTC